MSRANASLTFLVVDDDAQFRALVTRLLSMRGHRVIEAKNGQLAVKALDTEQPDMLIVDGLLPDGDGMSWIDARRKKGDKTPTVFVSAFWKDMTSFSRLTRELGVALVLHKPIAPHTFAQQLEDALGGAPPRNAAPTPRHTPPQGVPMMRAPMVQKAAKAVAPLRVEVESEQGALDLLAVLSSEYKKSLPDKLAELERLFGAVMDGAVADLPDARTAAHKLAGTAGSYGFAAIGQAAGELEQLAVRQLEGTRVATLEWARAIDGLRHRGTEGLGAPAREPLVRRHGCRVLLVDDDAAFRDMTRALGKQRAIDVVTADSAAQALALAAAGPFNAVLIDLRLAEGGAASQALAHALRALPGHASLPIAFVSAHGGLSDRIAAVHAGASLYLSKPLDADTLSTAVHQLTSEQRAAQPRALIVDDDPDFLRLAAAVLVEAGLEVTTLARPERILDKLEDVRPDVLLLDVNMPGASGFDVCRTIRATPRWQDLIVLFLTADGDTRSRVAGYEAGADDYLTKPVLREELLARVKVRVARKLLLRERLERDALTGLPLRRAFLDALSARLGEAERRQRRLALALVDVDRFKQVNDRFGHATGDRVLATLGGLLARRFRAEDLRGRWGGEEFVLAFPEEDQATVARILERVLAEFRSLEFVGDMGERFRCTFSVGVAGWPDDAEGAQSLVAAADRRLYAAKAGGRDRVIWKDEAV